MSKKDFTELDCSYRVRIDCFNSLGQNTKCFISQKSFSNYKEAWNYGLKESDKFQPCGFCVIYDELPKINIPNLIME